MSEFQLNTPVALIIFNRPATTERVFAEIAKARPPKLLVIADGPRSDRIGEAARCSATRAIVERIDWPCEVLTNYSDVNLGCKYRVSSGLKWVFEQVPEAIILEDDCLPEPTFFRFCEELLVRYRHNENIAMISGGNFQFGQIRGDDSYYFSRYTHIWGWASWRRAWLHYSVDAGEWPELQGSKWLETLFETASERKYWSNIFQAVYAGKIDTWDYQWMMTSWIKGMISIIPNVNLITNIGFGVDATHTFGKSMFDRMAVDAMRFPIRHPILPIVNKDADLFTEKTMFSGAQGGRSKRAFKYFVKLFFPMSWINFLRSKRIFSMR